MNPELNNRKVFFRKQIQGLNQPCCIVDPTQGESGSYAYFCGPSYVVQFLFCRTTLCYKKFKHIFRRVPPGWILGLDATISDACHPLTNHFFINLQINFTWHYCAHYVWANFGLNLLYGTSFYGRSKMNCIANLNLFLCKIILIICCSHTRATRHGWYRHCYL